MSAILALACSKNLEQTSALPDLETQESAQIEFAKILSKAVYADEDLRVFLKEEAIKQFDNDYDVFYPFVKDETISGGRTFREILVEHAGSDSKLQEIEEVLPLLTILVPDWSWINEECFSANTWDTSDAEVAVGYADYSDVHPIFVKGTKAAEIGVDEYPAFPVLIVKNNERLRVVSPATKGTKGSYEFVDEVFDGSKNPTTKGTYTQVWDYYTDASSNFVPEDRLNDLVIGAWDEFGKGWGKAMHRDYIYYGMTKTNTTNGELNTFIREKILRFQIDPNASYSMIDPGKDPTFNNEVERWRVENNLHGNEIQQYLWSDGSFEIYLTCYWGNGLPDELVAFGKSFSVRPQDLWELTQSTVKKTLRPFDGFQYRYVFTNSRDNLVAKWYYPSQDTDLPLWDISKLSSSMWFNVSEFDDKTTISKTITNTYKYTNNFTLTGKGEIGDTTDDINYKTSLGLEYSYGNERSEVSSDTITWDHTSNNLGDCEYSFDRSIIKSDRYISNGRYGYDLENVSSGTFCVTFVPHDIRK